MAQKKSNKLSQILERFLLVLCASRWEKRPIYSAATF